ncbi:hypothetical protein SKTS_30320 [Sulfurimicrobium lacus]|uniref:Uncharacterized protein n=1 Tax=Sulfurimicrobium lacus TaxID=2715678 RepID=A0A6F8VGJ8_9PROT|nr:hypothetical protein [Sulfurimicrobium lacus]BCB28146.1 hypothetical protein SKTS_30320 [Sulfurimicrobium lacus]
MLILIWASDVVLDLQGHTLGRGRLLKNPGGNGIEIVDKYTNIRILNGTLQDFHTGVFHDSAKYPAVEEVPTYDAQLNTYRFPKSGVVLENITFKNNKENFRIRIPREQKP